MAYNPHHEYEHNYDPAIKRYKIENARKGCGLTSDYGVKS